GGDAHRKKIFELRRLQRIAMRMQVDEPGRDDLAGSVNACRDPLRQVLLAQGNVAYEYDRVPDDGEIGPHRVASRAVEDRTVLDEDIDPRVLGQELAGGIAGRE